MAKKIIKLSLSHNSIHQAIDALDKYRDSLPYKCRLLAEKLAEEGVYIARYNVGKMDAVFTGELIESIRSEYVTSSNKTVIFCVKTDSSHSFFVEFGTGHIGKDNPYPYKLPDGVDWNYVSGNQIVANLEKGIYGWFYKDKNGEVRFTKGMPSRPFMYETSEKLCKIVVKVTKEVFR